jgi:tetratricopeptide (TPR) repeat protein/Ethanolamine utilization protein EutJ (predicted chaperonin)
MAELGIDFGTTNSSMARVREPGGSAYVLRDAEGHDKTPSVVFYGEDATLVGADAIGVVEDAGRDPAVEARFISGVKRNLFGAGAIALPTGPPLRAEQVVATIIAKLKADAEEVERITFEQVVITCPAMIETRHGEVLVDAATLAGFEEVELVEEPVAAATAFDRAGGQIGHGVLVYDFGGGTFDVAFVARDPGDERFSLALPPTGDTACGGDDIDQCLYDHFDAVAMRNLGRGVALDPNAVDRRFLRMCRRQKEKFSTADKAVFSTRLEGGVTFKASLSANEFERLILELVGATVRRTAELAQRARGAGHAVDTVLLVGGSSRLPLVGRLIREQLGIEPQVWRNRDVAVALGAAYHAARIWRADGGGRGSASERYRDAVELVWSDGRISDDERAKLGLRRRELGLSPAEAADVERAVMGKTLEELLAPVAPTADPRVANLVRRASQLRLAGNLEQALAVIEHALAIAPDSPDARAGRGEISALRYRVADAREDFDAALAASPDLVVALVGRARLASRCGVAEQAVRDADRAVELEPGSSDAWIARGIARLAAEQRTLALSDLERAVQLDPSSAEALAWRGFVRLRLGLDVEACEDFSRAIELDPDCVPALTGRAAAGEPGGDDALSHALAVDPRDPFALVVQAARQGDREQAREALDAALEASPDHPPALLARGRLAAASGRLDAALTDLDRAVEAAPYSADARYARALTLLELGDDVEAARELGLATRARGLSLTSAGGLHILHGRALLRQGRAAEAIEAFTAALGEEPGDGTALIARADAHLLAGEPEPAIADATAALEAEPPIPGARASRASALALLAHERGPGEVPAAFAPHLRDREVGVWHGRGTADGVRVEALMTTRRLLWLPPEPPAAAELWATGLPRLARCQGTDLFGLSLELGAADVSVLTQSLASLVTPENAPAASAPVDPAWPPPRLSERWSPPLHPAGARPGPWPAPLSWPPPTVR